MTARVEAAFLDCGRRNAGTPFEMASTPVRAVEPDENACRITNRPSGPMCPARFEMASTCWDAAEGHPPVAHRTNPTASMAKIEATNAYVGTAKSAPVSFTPRRLASVSKTTHASEISTVNRASPEAAPTIATTPATTETDTVST